MDIKMPFKKLKMRLTALPIGTIWLKCYIFIFLPILILLDILNNVRIYNTGLFESGFYLIYTIFRSLCLLCTLIFMLRGNKAGYYFNIALLACESVLIFMLSIYIYPPGTAASFYTLLTGASVAVSWFIFNFIYFQKRRFIFFDEYSKDINSHEELKQKYTELINEETAKKEAADKFKLRLDAYNKDKKWLRIYFYIFMPVCIAAEAIYIFVVLFALSNWQYFGLIKLSIILALTICTLINVRKINLKVVYYLNIILLIIEYSVNNSIFSYIFGFIFIVLNLIYFIKRKDFFFEEKAEIDKA